MALPNKFNPYSSEFSMFGTSPVAASAAAAAAPGLKAAAPNLLSSIPGWASPALGVGGLVAGGIGTYLKMQAEEEANDIRKKEIAEQMRQARVSEAFRERDWQDGNLQRGANASAAAYPALNAGADWRARLAALGRGAA